MNLSGKTLLIAAWGCLIIGMTLLGILKPEENKEPYIITMYYFMTGFSLIGIFQSFRKDTKVPYKLLNIFTFIISSLIIYSMSTDFLGALN